MSERVFTAVEIKAAIENYKKQQAAAGQQLEDLDQQIRATQLTQQMLQGAILAFESLLTLPDPPPPESQPDQKFDTIKE